ncbi:MAG: ribosome-associated translation inhibitor RaiA [Oscillospiraceae bacterium]|nr:ribosome-associated translation inhibitor RaiA [Oscillospiraceae bacterium]
MKFQFAEKRIDVEEDVKDYAMKKIGKLEKYFKKEADAQVMFSAEGQDKGRRVFEVTINNDGVFYRTRATGEDLYASVDHAVSAIERQIHKNKTRLEKKLRQGAFDRRESEPAPSVDEEKEFEIIRTKRFSLKPMTPEEAILQMNLLHHKFFVFRNFSNGGGFAVVYVREGGGYGMIEEG